VRMIWRALCSIRSIDVGADLNIPDKQVREPNCARFGKGGLPWNKLKTTSIQMW